MSEMTERDKRLRDLAWAAGWDAAIDYQRFDTNEAEQKAYERGWRDACDDALHQAQDPTWVIGNRLQQPYVADAPVVAKPDNLERVVRYRQMFNTEAQ